MTGSIIMRYQSPGEPRRLIDNVSLLSPGHSSLSPSAPSRCSRAAAAAPARRPRGADSGPTADASSTPDSGTDSATAADTSVPAGKGLIISNATVASLDGTYDIQVMRFAGTGGIAFNGNFDGKIEIEIDTDTAGVVKTAHVWNYMGTGMNVSPDKFYGCDGKATACTGVTVDSRRT